MTRNNPTEMSTVSAIPNNQPSYLSFGLAWLLGYSAYALTDGDNPTLPIPSATAPILLLGGLLIALIITAVVATQSQRGTHGREALIGKLLAASWLIGFTALSLLITALSAALDEPQVQTLLWPTGSGLVIGMIYLAGGAAHRDILQYTLGTWLAVISSAALFFNGPTLYWTLALAGGGSYLIAAALEPRRHTTPA